MIDLFLIKMISNIIQLHKKLIYKFSRIETILENFYNKKINIGSSLIIIIVSWFLILLSRLLILIIIDFLGYDYTQEFISNEVKPYHFFVGVLIVPIVETIVLIMIFKLISQFTKSDILRILSTGLLISFIHDFTSPISFFIHLLPSLIFCVNYAKLKEKSQFKAFSLVFLTHSFANSMALFFILLL